MHVGLHLCLMLSLTVSLWWPVRRAILHTHTHILVAIVSHTAGHRVVCQLCSIISLPVLASVCVSVCVFVQTCSQLREPVHGSVRAALFPFNWLKMGKQDLGEHTVPITLTHKKWTRPRRTLMKHTYWHTTAAIAPACVCYFTNPSGPMRAFCFSSQCCCLPASHTSARTR